MTAPEAESNAADNSSNTEAAEANQSPATLSVVGIGASAGGLAPLRTFFAAIPPDSGLTFVVVIHLSPDHESILAELLQGYTTMPVTQVQGRTAMLPNHVYVIPPAKALLVSDGHLDLDELQAPLGRRLQIDSFFRSLAKEHGDGAAIILSGSGTDGAVGIRAIKEHGGLLLVQSPAEAEYDGMPKSAIDTGLVDVVAPVAELAAQLVAAKRTQASLEVPTDPHALSRGEQQTLAQILTQLQLRTGHDFGGYREATLLRRILRRMKLAHLQKLSVYLDRLRRDDDEVDALYRDVLIHVTEFFRDKEAWATLAQELVPQLFADKADGEEVRVWTVGCATGEEAYSIAMLLLEHAATLVNPPPIQIFASDLGRIVLDFARRGIYPEAIMADVPAERLERFFIHDDSHYQVRSEVRDLVLFTPHNLLQDPPFSKLDLILCRNVLIYLQRPVQERVFETFHYALRPQGYLFLGSAESADAVSELFETVDKRQRLYRRSQQLNKVVLPSLPLLPRNSSRAASTEAVHQASHTRSAQHRLLLEEIGLPSLLVDEQHQVLHYSESVWRYLAHPAGLPTHDVLRLVRPELQSEVRLALYRAFSEDTNTYTRPILVQFNGTPHPVIVLVRPNLTQHRALLLFWETSMPELSTSHEVSSVEAGGRAAHLEVQLLHSEQQLQSSREEYESSVEELRAANEELQSTNEEYRSTLEELETSKEELQSVNEELRSVNQEMKVRMEEIATANSDLQNLFAATEIATLFLDRELCVKRYTPRAAELFNLMPSDRGRPIRQLRTKLKYPTLEADMQRVLSSLSALEHEVEAEDRRWYLVGIRPYRTTQNKIDGIVVTCVDISANKTNEEALREANQQLSRAHSLFSSLFHANPIPTALTRPQDGVVLDANEAYLRFFEVPREAAIGSPLHHFGQWLQPDERAKLAEQARQEGHVGSFEITTRQPSGQTKTALVSIERVEQDGTEAAIWAFVDITALKQAQENLRRSEDRLRLTLESVTDYAVITLDTSGQIVDWRGGAEQMFGYRKAEVLGQPSAILFTPEDRVQRAPEMEIEQARATGRAADERWHMRKDGTRFYMSGVMVPLRDGEIIGYVKVARDLTERRQMEEDLESEVQARTEQVRTLATQLTLSEQEERRRISAILHDDLQQQLFSLNVQLAILHQLLDSQALTEAHQTIAEIGEALHNSIQVTRNLSVDLSPPVLRDEGLYEAIRWLASHMEQQQGLHVEVKKKGKVPIVDEDLRVLLFQVVRELLFNIVKHAGVNTAIVALAADNKQFHIKVSDKGQGFDMNRQMALASQGLARIQQRLELVGGQVQVTSNPGQGTQILIHVPQAPKKQN